MRITTAAIVSICFASFAWSSAAGAQTASKPKPPPSTTVYTVTGEASTNNLDQNTTLGSAELKLHAKGAGRIKLTCGLLGQIQAQNSDGSLTIQHTVACDDHSLLILNTTTFVTVQSACTTRPGFVGTFHEVSTVSAVDGPFAGATGQITSDGTINCGFNELQIKGTITRP